MFGHARGGGSYRWSSMDFPDIRSIRGNPRIALELWSSAGALKNRRITASLADIWEKTGALELYYGNKIFYGIEYHCRALRARLVSYRWSSMDFPDIRSIRGNPRIALELWSSAGALKNRRITASLADIWEKTGALELYYGNKIFYGIEYHCRALRARLVCLCIQTQ